MKMQSLSSLARDLRPFILGQAGILADDDVSEQELDMRISGGLYVKGPLPWADIRAWGAVGDGTTNDTAAIQAAYDAIPSTGGVLNVPPGEYLFDGLVITKPIILRGGGGNISGSDATAMTILKYSGSGIAIDVQSGGRGTILQNFRLIDGNAGTIGIRLDCNEPRVINVYIWNTTETDAADAAGWSVAAIQVGPSTQVNDLLLRDVYIRAVAADGVQLHWVSEGTIDHCRLVHCHDNGFVLGLVGVSDATACNFLNGTAVTSANVSASCGVKIVRAEYKTTFHGCYFEHDAASGATYAIDSDGASVCRHIVIDNCYFVGDNWGANADYAIRANVAHGQWAVKNSYFREFALAGILASSAVSIRLEDNVWEAAVPRLINSYNLVRYASPSQTIVLTDTGAATDTYTIGTSVLGLLKVHNRTDGVSAIFELRAGGHTVNVLAATTGWFAGGASTTAGRLCCYWDGTNYILENNLGGSRTITFSLES